MKKFKYLRGVGRTYREQGLIYFACMNYGSMPPEVREKIGRLCESAGGEHAATLPELCNVA